MVTIFLVVVWAMALLLILPALSDAVSLIRIAMRRQPPAPPSTHPPRLLFLVPAHDEEVLIEACVRSLRGLRYPATGRAIVVLADNCTDRTVEVARAAGAQILERHDRERPGKPEALAWALPRLALDRYDAVVIVDADAVVDPEFAIALAQHAPLADKAVQSYEDVRNPDESSITRMAAVLAAGRFRGAFRLKQRVGLNTPLGNGMCLGTGVLLRRGWQAFGLSEDCETYAQLTADGVRTELESGAHLYAQEEGTLRGSSTQRKRWLAGRWQAIARVGPRLVASTAIGWHQKLDAFAELAVPGPALHLACAAALIALVVVAGLPGAAVLSAVLAGTLMRPAIYALVGLYYHPKPRRALIALLFLPIYALWRAGLLVGTLRLARNGAWVRTGRHDAGPLPSPR